MPYLFRLRATRNVNRALQKAMLERDWTDSGQGWQGKETSLRLMGWSRQRRVILLRRKLDRPLAGGVGEFGGYLKADAGGRAGDEGGFVVEVQIHDGVSFCCAIADSPNSSALRR